MGTVKQQIKKLQMQKKLAKEHNDILKKFQKTKTDKKKMELYLKSKTIVKKFNKLK